MNLPTKLAITGVGVAVLMLLAFMSACGRNGADRVARPA